MKKILLLLVLIVCSIIGFLYAYPSIALQTLINGSEIKAGIAELSIKTSDGYTVSYYDNEATEKPVLVMLHGLTGKKENWLSISSLLKNYRIIAPDFIGHGKTMPQALEQDYSIENYVTYLNSFLSAIDVTSFTLIGNSLGGMVAGLYAHKHPEQIEQLIFIANAGIDSKIKTNAFQEGINNGINSYVVRTLQEFNQKMDLLFYKKPILPGPLNKHAAQLSIQKADLHQKLFDDIEKNPNLVGILEPLLSDIKARTLIIWGAQDKVVHLSSVEKMEKTLPTNKVVVFDNCGHLPMMEKPKKTANVIKEFLANN